jgi:hypothetical protein
MFTAICYRRARERSLREPQLRFQGAWQCSAWREGDFMSAAGPLPKRSYRSAQGGGCLMSAAGPLPTANSAMRSMEDA